MRRASLDLADAARNLEESVGSPVAGSPEFDVDLSMPLPEEDEDVDDQDEVNIISDVARVYTPPPHIAARFYKPTITRRKDSAASSRRNSISSVPSLASHGCGRGSKPQSNYVAHHLRRASILEDRKARLADRAAHAEKVRLRAAMTKAASRDISASEERALAAAQTREKNLADIAAACAEEVKRAKAVAESTKEKREQELVRARQQMEERQAEAERRREELRNRNSSKSRVRGQSLVTARKSLELAPESKEIEHKQESPMSEDFAASIIHFWWKAAQRKRDLRTFQELGLTMDGVRDTPFEKVTDLLSQDKVLLVTGRVLRICGLAEGQAHSVEEMAAIRTFLSAFLILGHPSQVLSGRDTASGSTSAQSGTAASIARDDLANPQLQELVGKARDLLICFQNIFSRLTSTNNYTCPPAVAGALAESYATFHNAFISWKARDSTALIDVMLMQFVELDAIWQTVKDSTDPSVTESYRQSIQNNQMLLLVRIKKLAGAEQGKKKVFDAVRQARKEREAKKPKGDVRPREADETLETALGGLDAGSAATSVTLAQTQAPTPPPTPPLGRLKVRVHVPQSRILPPDRVIVHELAINQDYRMSSEQYRDQHAQILEPLYAQMRETMLEEQQEQHFLLLLQIMRTIREKLQRLVREGKTMHNFIGELLDTEVAQSQFRRGSFSYEKFFSTMGQLLPKLCAPVRDDEVKELVESKLKQADYVSRLESLMGFIDIMLADHANWTLSMYAPQLIQSGPEWEAARFAKALREERHGLAVAEKAWRDARTKVLAEAAKRDPEGVSHPRSRPKPERYYSQMLLDLFTQLSPITLEEMPEMLHLDHERAVKSGQLTRRIITAAAILLQCKNLLKRDVRVPWKTEAQRIILVLERSEGTSNSNATIAEGIMIALESGRSMPVATKTHLRAIVNKLVCASIDISKPREEGSAQPRAELKEPILRLLYTRLRGHMLARFTAGSASEKVKATSTAGERLGSLGLAEFVTLVREMIDEIAKVGTVDRAAHGAWWDEIETKVAQESAAA